MEVLTLKSFRLWGFDFLRRNGVTVRRRRCRATPLVEPQLCNCLACLDGLASHQLLLCRLKIDCLGVEFQLSPLHCWARPISVTHVNSKSMLSNISASSAMAFRMNVVCTEGFGGAVVESGARIRKGGKIHREFASIPDSRPKQHGK